MCLLFFFNFYFFIQLCQVLVAVCRSFHCSMWDLVPQPGIEPGPPALGAWSRNHWATRKVPKCVYDLSFSLLWLIQHYNCLLLQNMNEIVHKTQCVLPFLSCLLVYMGFSYIESLWQIVFPQKITYFIRNLLRKVSKYSGDNEEYFQLHTISKS